MKLTQEQINRVNSQCPYDQGVFFQPYGIPVGVNEHVIYMRWESHGYSGGNCWDDSDPEPYENEKPEFKVLDLVLAELKPDISYLNYKKVQNLIKSNENTEWEYYGNSTTYGIQYVVLSELENFLKNYSLL